MIGVPVLLLTGAIDFLVFVHQNTSGEGAKVPDDSCLSTVAAIAI